MISKSWSTGPVSSSRIWTSVLFPLTGIWWWLWWRCPEISWMAWKAIDFCSTCRNMVKLRKLPWSYIHVVESGRGSSPLPHPIDELDAPPPVHPPSAGVDGVGWPGLDCGVTLGIAWGIVLSNTTGVTLGIVLGDMARKSSASPRLATSCCQYVGLVKLAIRHFSWEDDAMLMLLSTSSNIQSLASVTTLDCADLARTSSWMGVLSLSCIGISVGVANGL